MKHRQAHQRRSSKDSVDLLAVFDRENLSRENLGSALQVFSSAVYSGDVTKIIESVRKTQHLFEFIYSQIDDSLEEYIRDALSKSFAPTSLSFIDSFAASLLQQLAHYFEFLHYPSDDVKPSHLRDNIHDIQCSLNILKQLSVMNPESPIDDRNNHDHDTPESLPFFKPKKSQPKKQRRNTRKAPPVDNQPFRTLGVDVPSSPEDVLMLSEALIKGQCDYLNVYLGYLRRENLREIIKEAYLPSAPSLSTQGVTQVFPSDGQSIAEIKQASTSESNVASTPAAYPMVQPMTAAMYFRNANGFGSWQLFLSSRAIKDLKDADKGGIFPIIIKKLKELSKGHFSTRDNQKRLSGGDHEVPIYEAKLDGDRRLVYQVDVIPEDCDDKREHQVLRFFGVYTHAQMNNNRLWDALSHQLTRKGDDYIRRCKFRRKDSGDVYSPMSWPYDVPTNGLEKELPLPTDDRTHLDKLHELLVLEKYVPFSQALYNSILAGADVTHPFAVSPQEREIVDHPSSCYVLGRSGTGKTTTMMFKMLNYEMMQASPDTAVIGRKRRQMFVTQSRVLARRVQEYFGKLLASLKTAALTREELQNVMRQKAADENDELIDEDDEGEEGRSDLPKRFSELEDKHFPLFVTFDELCRLVENDLGLSFARRTYVKEFRKVERRTRQRSLAAEVPVDLEVGSSDDENNDPLEIDEEDLSANTDNPVFVDFDEFMRDFWPHFPQREKKGLDPVLVLGEFLGVIMGSEEALTQDNGYLSRNDYMRLSHRKQSTFATRRSDVYGLFEVYQRRKGARGSYDAADRAHQIIKHLKGAKSLRPVDNVYVDEVQDNLLVDSLILRHLSSNPHGLFWAGDTAQTIAVGSSFRFEALKAFQHRIEEKMMKEAGTDIMVKPEMFQLTTNYRSHGGIVNCANTITQLVYEFWPDMIDKLNRESGLVDGIKPIFFTGWGQDNVRYEQFLFGDSGHSVEFGARQCIIVRNDAARNRLKQQIGEIGLILTLYESKGLEFDDVLLYNFFEDSPFDSPRWRVVLNAMETLQATSRVSAPAFDDVRHAGICTELKFLYVAITRARKNLWIVDNSEKGDPMKTLLESKKQIDVYTPEREVPVLAATSTTEEWMAQGKALFRHKRYAQAIHCFRRAKANFEQNVANAYHLRQQARKTSGTGFKGAQILAAQAFEQCAEASRRRTADYDRRAADCYVLAGDFGAAAKAFLRAKKFTESAQNFRKAAMFDEAVEVIKNNRNYIPDVISERILTISKLFYLRGSDANLEKALAQLFHSAEEVLEFAEDYGLDVARTSLLERMGRKTEAAEIHLSEGRTERAIELLLDDRASHRRAAECILNVFWRIYPFGTAPAQPTATQQKKFLLYATRLDSVQLSQLVVDEVLTFRLIASGDLLDILRHCQNLHLVHKNYPYTVRLLDHFISLLDADFMSKAQTHMQLDIMHACRLYVEKLRMLCHSPELCALNGVPELFGFEKAANREITFLVYSNSVLYEDLARHVHCRRWHDGSLLVDEGPLTSSIRRAIHARLSWVVERLFGVGRVEDAQRVFPKLRDPCYTFIINKQCNYLHCQREHVKVDRLWFEIQLRTLSLQLVILHASSFAVGDVRSLRKVLCRPVLERFFRTIHTFATDKEGFNVTMLKNVPEFESAQRAIADWNFTEMMHLHPYATSRELRRYFLDEVFEAVVLAVSTDRRAAIALFNRADFYSGQKHPALLRNKVHYVVHDLVRFTSASEQTFIAAGAAFVKHIVENDIDIDISYLCRIVEDLCGAAAIILTYTRNRGHLHNLTLPRSCIVRNLTGLDETRNYELRLLHFIPRSVEMLLGALAHGSDDRVKHFHHLGGIHGRNIMIHRLCRAMCLLGYNVPNQDLRADIVRAVGVLAKPGAMLTPINRSYSLCRNWLDFARTARNSLEGSATDEMVHLVWIRAPYPVTTPRGIRRFVFANMVDLRNSFSAMASTTITLSATAPSFEPKRLVTTPNSRGSAAEASAPEEDSDKPDESESQSPAYHPHTANEDNNETEDAVRETEEVVLEQATEAVMDSVPGQPDDRTYNDEEMEVITRFLSLAVKVVRKRHALQNQTQSNGLICSFYAQCLDVADEISWEQTFYRKLLLGAVPHVLVCLDTLSQVIGELKTKAQRRMKTAKHLELEEVEEQMTRARGMRKEFEALKKKVEPKSPVHRNRDVRLSSLKQTITSIIDLAGRAGVDSEDIKLAYKAVVQQPAPPKHRYREKPTLNTDDLDGYDGYSDE